MSIDKKISYVNQDGYKNYTKNSDSVTVPRKFKSKENATPTKLAYITADEAKMLKKIKKGTPHKGPSGIPSYDDYDASKGDYGAATTGEQMSGFEGGAKGERSRADARSLGMSPTDVQDIRSSAIAAGTGQNVNPSFFGPRDRVSKQELARAKGFAPEAYRATRGSRFGIGNLFGAALGLINPFLGMAYRGIKSIPGVFDTFKNSSTLVDFYNNIKNKGGDEEKEIFLSNFQRNPNTGKYEYVERVNPDYDDFGNEFALGATSSPFNTNVATGVAPMSVNVPSGIQTLDIGFDNPTFNNKLIADASYDQQKNMLENILNTEDTGVGQFIEDKELKDQRQKDLLNEILTG